MIDRGQQSTHTSRPISSLAGRLDRLFNDATTHGTAADESVDRLSVRLPLLPRGHGPRRADDDRNGD